MKGTIIWTQIFLTNFFSNNFIVDVFLFVTAIILLLVTTLVIYLLCKHKKLRTPATSLTLQQMREVGAVATQHVLAKFSFIQFLH